MAELWPFRPQTGNSESLEWLTEILSSRTGEQRISLRPTPRQVFNYTVVMEEQEFSRAKQFAKGNASKLVKVPVWVELTQYSGPILSSDTTITFDTSNADYRVGEDIMLWEHSGKYASIEIDTVSPTGVTLAVAVGAGFTSPILAPVRSAWAIEGYKFERESNISSMNARFQVTENLLLASVLTYPQYTSLDVLTDGNIIISDVSENITRAMEYIDNGFGIVEAETVINYDDFGQTIGFIEYGNEALWGRRTWLHSLQGKQKPFWLPTHNQDFVLVDDIGSADTILSVNSIGGLSDYISRHIMIELNDGTRFFRQIVNAANDINDVDLITISSSLGQAVAITDVKFFSFISKVRLNSDSVEISYLTTGISTISIPVMEVPE